MKRRAFIKQLGLAAALPWLGRAALAAANAPQKTNSSPHKILTCKMLGVEPALLPEDIVKQLKELGASMA